MAMTFSNKAIINIYGFDFPIFLTLVQVLPLKNQSRDHVRGILSMQSSSIVFRNMFVVTSIWVLLYWRAIEIQPLEMSTMVPYTLCRLPFFLQTTNLNHSECGSLSISSLF